MQPGKSPVGVTTCPLARWYGVSDIGLRQRPRSAQADRRPKAGDFSRHR